MAFGDADRNALLADFGVDVTYSAVTVKGIVDEADWNAMNDPRFSGVTRTVLIATGALTVPQAASLVVGGTTYTVVDSAPDLLDGRFTRILLHS